MPKKTSSDKTLWIRIRKEMQDIFFMSGKYVG